MPQGVIDLLEVIHIANQQGPQTVPGALNARRSLFKKSTPIQKKGQRIKITLFLHREQNLPEGHNQQDTDEPKTQQQIGRQHQQPQWRLRKLHRWAPFNSYRYDQWPNKRIGHKAQKRSTQDTFKQVCRLPVSKHRHHAQHQQQRHCNVEYQHSCVEIVNHLRKVIQPSQSHQADQQRNFGVRAATRSLCHALCNGP